MFEDKRRGKKVGFYIVGLLLLIAFSASYFINMDLDNETNSFNKTNSNLKIPESLKHTATIDINSIVNGDKSGDQEDFILKENQKINYITYFTICSHKVERKINLPSVFIGMREEEFMEKNPGWYLAEINADIITLTRDIETHCPKHYIIGIEGEYIAIYTYDENGVKLLREKTDIDIDTLTPEDQAILESGIVADTEDDMELKLEGFSN